MEFAIVAPIVFFFIFALIEFAGLLMSQNVITAAAREGGRVASLPGTVTSEAVVSVVEERAGRGGIDPSLINVTVDPVALSAVGSGDEVRVSVSAAVSDLGWVWAIAPTAGATLRAQSTSYRE